MIAESTTADALLSYVCQHPSDDVARLAYADLLEEQGEDARAEFIRVQVELWARRDEYDSYDLMERGPTYDALQRRERELLEAHYREWMHADLGPLCDHLHWRGATNTYCRGFVAEVALTVEAFAGGPCGQCSGWFQANQGDSGCPACRGTGKTPGHAAALFRAAPIERVTLSDRTPYYNGAGYAWFNSGRVSPSPDVPDASELPEELFRLLAGGVSGFRWRAYPTAHDALAAAALLLGRRRAWPCPHCKGRGRTYIAGGGEPEDDPDCFNCRGTGHTVTTNPE